MLSQAPTSKSGYYSAQFLKQSASLDGFRTIKFYPIVLRINLQKGNILDIDDVIYARWPIVTG